MRKKVITPEGLAEAEGAAEGALRELATAKWPNSPRLKLTGLEILAFLGAKIAVPVVCSFLSKALYDSYKGMQTKSQAEQAKTEIVERSAEKRSPVDEKTVIGEVSAQLVADGIPQEAATKIVTEIYRKLRAEYC